ncbi:Uma2 family endonuclease [Arvimicrobium flavum]|uniref:Uma2 family endonuclease n=1 Tax=Arvimicrobium flavum TaxID=3393320 RepID=UPI00237B0AE5|nr:Uma2 family endonuclease [Mesorhizobium shangrilense]
MNEHAIRFGSMPGTTQAADGMPRRAWTVAEIEAMVRAGIIGEDERFELIGGEVVPMLPKGGRHEMVKIELNRHFQRSVADDLSIAPETTLRLDDTSFLEPDFCVFPRSIFPGDMRGYHVLLAIEVADTSLFYDLGRKRGVYAAFGIPEVWVIDANTLVTHVHRQLGPNGYADILEMSSTDTLTATRAPSVSMCLEQLKLAPL